MSDTPVFERILRKGAEYYQCARHVNIRGLGDVVKETADIVKAAKASGMTFDALLTDIEAKFGQKPNLAKDKFLVVVQKQWEEL